MTIAHFEVSNFDREYLGKKLDGQNLFFESNDIENNLEKIQDIQILTIFIYTKITPEVLDKLPNLKLIITRSTGFDHIDIQACKQHGIAVCNIPSYGQNTVAEHTFGLILIIAKHLYKQVSNSKKSNFADVGFGFDLADQTIGIIGTGQIGLKAIQIAKGFGMNVLAYDIYPNLKAEKEMGFKYVEKNYLLNNSDIISLHIPYSKQNHHFIGHAEFNLMKKGVVIINTARGALIDNKALEKALDENKLSAAGLDVLEDEASLFQGENAELQKLIQRDNVFFTPHTAYKTIQAEQRILDSTQEIIKQFESGNLKNSI
jgi:D-lactate dehydrogenase